MLARGPVARVSEALSTVAALLLFAIGIMLTYEVTARYFFNAPTVWAEELSRLAMIWAVFLGSAAMLARGEHIRVTLLIDSAPPALRRVADAFSLVFVAVIAALVAWNAVPTAWNSYVVGRSTGSMLDLPSWWAQAAVPIGFALLALQSAAMALGVLLRGERFGAAPDPDAGGP